MFEHVNRIVLACALVLAHSCTPAPPATPHSSSSSSASASSSESPAIATSATASSSPAIIVAAVCDGRAACRVVETHDAGTAGKDALLVVKVWIGAPAYVPNVHEEGGCPDFEWWSLVVRASAIASKQFLVAGGNECLQWGGGGATIARNQFTYVFTGSGAPIMVTGLPYTTVMQLAPFAIVSGPGAMPKSPERPVLDYVGW
jgi:hypothetical protein